MAKSKLNISTKAPKFDFGGGGNDNQGVNALIGYMLGQQQSGDVGKSSSNVNSEFPEGIAPVGSSLNPKGANIELNRALPENAESTIRLGRQQGVNLKNNLQQYIGSKNLQSRTTPLNPGAWDNAFGNTFLQIQGMMNNSDISQFAEFKSGTQQLFQQYRKYITGVQAGFPELQMLQPIFPIATDPPSIYLGKALQAIKTMKTNEETLVDYESKRGYNMGNLPGSYPVNPDEIRQSALQAGINVHSDNIESKKQSLRERYLRGA